MTGKFLDIKDTAEKYFHTIWRNLAIDQRELYLSAIALVSILVVIPGITYAAYTDDLYTKERIMNKNNTGVILLDRNGEEFFRFYQAKRPSHAHLSQIPLHTQQAIIASE